MWRAVLRCSDLQSSSIGTGKCAVCADLLVSFEHPVAKGALSEYSPLGIFDLRNSLYTRFRINASGFPSERERQFIAWIRQRAVGAVNFSLDCVSGTQDPGWAFAELVLAVSSSGGETSAKPPVTLDSSMSSNASTKPALAFCRLGAFHVLRHGTVVV